MGLTCVQPITLAVTIPRVIRLANVHSTRDARAASIIVIDIKRLLFFIEGKKSRFVHVHF